MATTRSRTIGGNPLRNLAIRQGKSGIAEAEPKPKPYTEADRRALLAPISVGILSRTTIRGKSWAGSVPYNPTMNVNVRERYSHVGDWPDIDNT